MPDAQAPTDNKVVISFCELVGLMFGLPAGEALYRGEPLSGRMLVFGAVGLCFAALGPAWPWVKSRFPSPVSVALVRMASDFRWWFGLLLLAFAYAFLIPELIHKVQPAAPTTLLDLTDTAHICDSATIVITNPPPLFAWRSSSLGLIGGALVAGFGFWIARLARKRRASPLPSSAATIGIQTPNNGEEVDFKQRVCGFVYPVDTPVQILVYSGDKLWHPQTRGACVRTERYKWSHECQFGNVDSSYGQHRVVAITGVDPIKDNLADIPPAAVHSEIIQVFRRARGTRPPGTGPQLIVECEVQHKPVPPVPPNATASEWLNYPDDAKRAAASHEAFLALLRIRNGATTDVRNLCAFLIFCDGEMNRFFAIVEGCWLQLHEKYPGFVPYLDRAPITLRAGDERCLALALKYPGDDFSHALDLRSCQRLNWQEPDLKINSYDCHVWVEFQFNETESIPHYFALIYGGPMHALTPRPRALPKKAP